MNSNDMKFGLLFQRESCCLRWFWQALLFILCLQQSSIMMCPSKMSNHMMLYHTNPTTRMPYSFSVCLSSVTKNADGNFSGTKRATRDPLVSKLTNFLGL